MNDLNFKEQLDRIEKLLLANKFKDKKVLTFDEACEYTGLSPSYLYKLTASNKIPFSKPMGKQNYFEVESLNKWLLRKSRKSEYQIKEVAKAYQ